MIEGNKLSTLKLNFSSYLFRISKNIKLKLLITLLATTALLAFVASQKTSVLSSSTDVQWTEVLPEANPRSRYLHAMAYDTTRGVVVMFGGHGGTVGPTDTLEYSEGAWTQMHPVHEPGDIRFHQMAYDPIRQKTVMFDGSNTWVWDGNDWTQLTPDHNPPGRYGHMMTYDSANGKVLLFGGADDISLLNDTWVWDGNDWTELHPATPPLARSQAGMAYDSAEGVAILYGGTHGGTDTWKWDGSNWTELATMGAPGPRQADNLVYDEVANKVFLFGGNSIQDGLWEWDYSSSTWLEIPTVGGPGARSYTAMVYDNNRNISVLFGGLTDHTLKDTWELDGVSGVWTETSIPYSPPAMDGKFVYDSQRHQAVLFGGRTSCCGRGISIGQTWIWNSQTLSWQRPDLDLEPPNREGHVMSYDSARGRTVLFGGYRTSGVVNDTWEWNGEEWTPVVPNTSPPSLYDAGMAFDEASGVTILFGGNYSSGVYSNETWEWDGENWEKLVPPTSPSPRGRFSLVYDKEREVIVLVGGISTSEFDETWEWDGDNWNLVASGNAPQPATNYSLAYDEDRGVTVLFGGISISARVGDTWEWDGSSWIKQESDPNISARVNAPMTYDATQHKVILFGGDAPDGHLADDTWTYGSTTQTEEIISLSPADVWIGLKNSDDVGIRFDLLAEVYKGSDLIGSGQLDSVKGGSSGFNNAILNSIPLNLFSPVSVSDGDQLNLKLYVRNACSGSGKNSGKARLWYNDSQADSHFDATINENINFYLLNEFALGNAPGLGLRLHIDVAAGAKCSPFKLFGTWNTIH
jgi:hypothetical protein